MPPLYLTGGHQQDRAAGLASEGADLGARLRVWLVAEPGASPLAPPGHSSFPRAENIKVDTLATKPWAGVELGAEITMAKFCLMLGASLPKEQCS